MESEVFSSIHAMTDVTNGGLRGDAFEMAQTAGCRIVIDEEATRVLVEPHVRKMLDELRIDYLGVSLDALLVVAPQDTAEKICRDVTSAGVMIREIGSVEKGKPEAVLRVDGTECDFSPRFRESAYTPVKKVVDIQVNDFDRMKEGVLHASEAALNKRDRILSRLRSRKNQ
jgi:hydrogenase expression/formation protein